MKHNTSTLKYVIYIILFILFIELCYALYGFLFAKKNNIYFDGINTYKYMDSNYIAVGSNNNNDKYYEKAKLSIFDKDLNKMKEKLYNKGYNSTFYDVIKDEDNYIVVGSYEATRNDHLMKNRRGMIVKYDKDDNIVFEKELSHLANSSITAIKLVKDGYIVCGNSNYSSNNITNTNAGGAYLIKYSKDGKVIWERNIGDKSSAKFNDFIIVDNYIFAVGINNINVGLIVKYDINGNFLTSYDYRNTDNLGFSNVVYRDGYAYVCGCKKTEKSSKGLIVRFDDNLGFVDEKVYNENNSRYNKLLFDEDHLIVIGTVDKDDYDGIIGKYNDDLSEIDIVKYGDEEDDYFTDVKIIDNKYVVVGYSSYEDSLLTKFIYYSDALKVLEVK